MATLFKGTYRIEVLSLQHLYHIYSAHVCEYSQEIDFFLPLASVNDFPYGNFRSFVFLSSDCKILHWGGHFVHKKHLYIYTAKILEKKNIEIIFAIILSPISAIYTHLGIGRHTPGQLSFPVQRDASTFCLPRSRQVNPFPVGLIFYYFLGVGVSDATPSKIGPN